MVERGRALVLVPDAQRVLDVLDQRRRVVDAAVHVRKVRRVVDDACQVHRRRQRAVVEAHLRGRRGRRVDGGDLPGDAVGVGDVHVRVAPADRALRAVLGRRAHALHRLVRVGRGRAVGVRVVIVLVGLAARQLHRGRVVHAPTVVVLRERLRRRQRVAVVVRVLVGDRELVVDRVVGVVAVVNPVLLRLARQPVAARGRLVRERLVLDEVAGRCVLLAGALLGGVGGQREPGVERDARVVDLFLVVFYIVICETERT